MASVYDPNEIVIDKSIRSAGFRMKRDHSHACCELYYLLSGSCTFEIEGTFYPLYAGEMIIVAPNASHSTDYNRKTGCERIVVNYYPEYLLSSPLLVPESLNDKLITSGKIVFHGNQAHLDQLFEQMLTESISSDQYHQGFMSSMLRLVFLTIARYGQFIYNETAANELGSADIHAAINYMVRNYSQPLTLVSVAEFAGLTPSYFSLKMKKVTGTTFKHYLLMIRLKAAARMLLNTDDSITFIATECGFNSSNYFKDCFRKYTGVSPSIFRKNADSSVIERLSQLLEDVSDLNEQELQEVL